ncbi:hypothetical protein C5473_14840 [Leptospira interrogans serovar Weerasinghe]|nr:hypothetical protein C5473_14840 [Leptospira interrogans serovar Weerasinghe]
MDYEGILENLSNRIVEKLILYRFSLYGNGRLKRFVNCCYGIFNNSNIVILKKIKVHSKTVN